MTEMSAEIGEDSADEERGEIAPSPTAEGGAAGAKREQGEGYEKEENPFPLMYHAVPKPVSYTHLRAHET